MLMYERIAIFITNNPLKPDRLIARKLLFMMIRVLNFIFIQRFYVKITLIMIMMLQLLELNFDEVC